MSAQVTAEKARARLTEGPIGGKLFGMMLGMLVGHMAMTVFNLTDTYFVGQLGTEQLAAMSFTFPVVFFIMSMIFGLGIGASSVISHAIGQGDHHRVRQLTTHVLILGVLVALALSVLGQIFARPLFYMRARAATCWK